MRMLLNREGRQTGGIPKFYSFGRKSVNMEKTALVTGAGRGIGRSVAEHLAKAGYKVVAVSRTENELASLAGSGNILPFTADVTQAADRQAIARFCRENGIGPQVLVNNAGAYLTDDLFTGTSELQANLDINLIQARELTALVWPTVRSVKGAYVFNIVSVLGKAVRAEAASYTLAKHAMAGYNKLLFREGRKQGVKVTGIFPASVYTSAWEGSGVDPQRLIAPADIAQLVLSCLALSPAAVPEEIHLQCMDELF